LELDKNIVGTAKTTSNTHYYYPKASHQKKKEKHFLIGPKQM
jgi:hypothetical protein